MSIAKSIPSPLHHIMYIIVKINFSELKMNNDSEEVPVHGINKITPDDTFQILNQSDMKDFTFGVESFCLVLAEENRPAVNESLSTSLILPVDTKSALKNLLSDSANADDSYVKNNSVCKESVTIDANEEVFNVSDERIELASNRTFDTEGFQKAFEMQGGLLNSIFDKANSCSNYEERKPKITSLDKKVEIDALERKSGLSNKTFDAETIVVDVNKSEFTSKLQYSPNSKTELFSTLLPLRNNNELSDSRHCHSTPMKGIENVVGCNNSSDAEIKIEVFSDESPVLSPSPANKPVRSNLLDVMSRDVSGTDNIINDETFDRNVKSCDETFEKYSTCYGTDVGGRKSHRNPQSLTSVSQVNPNTAFEKIVDHDGLPHDEMVGMNVSGTLASPVMNSGTVNIINDDTFDRIERPSDETFDGNINPRDETFEKKSTHDGTDLGSQKSHSNLQSLTSVSQVNSNATFEKIIDKDGLPHVEVVVMNALGTQASPKNVIDSQENVCEVEDAHLSMPMESDDHSGDAKGLEDDSSKLLIKNSRHGTNKYDTKAEDKLSVKDATYGKNASLNVAPLKRKPMPDSILVQKSAKSAFHGNRNNTMNMSRKACTGPIGASSKLNRKSIVPPAGKSTFKTGQSSSERLVQEKKENLQRWAMSDKDNRSVGESKFGKQPSQSVMQKSIPAALAKETSQITSNVPGLPRKSGIPMPSRATTSSLKGRSQIPTCIKRGR